MIQASAPHARAIGTGRIDFVQPGTNLQVRFIAIALQLLTDTAVPLPAFFEIDCEVCIQHPVQIDQVTQKREMRHFFIVT